MTRRAPVSNPEEVAKVIDVEPGEVQSMSTSSAIVKAELDQQIVTARAYPRSITRFRKDVVEMACMTLDIAAEMLYALPRKNSQTNKNEMIEGPSARLAEIVANAWGNCRAGSRVLEVGAEDVVAQGYFVDLERNVGIYREVRRRITNREGRRFSADMIAVTANAACSIAMRNAVFSGVPKSFWSEAYERARATVAGKAETMDKRRGEVLDTIRKMGVVNERIYATIGVEGAADIGVDEIVQLQGMITAIRSEEMSVDEVFPDPKVATVATTPAATGSGVSGLKEALAEARASNAGAAQARASAERLAAAGQTEAAAEFTKAAEKLEGGEAPSNDPGPMCSMCPNESSGKGPDGQFYCGEHMPKEEKKKAKG